MKIENLLIELLTEELPPSSQKELGLKFSEFIASKLGCTEIRAVQLIKFLFNP